MKTRLGIVATLLLTSAIAIASDQTPGSTGTTVQPMGGWNAANKVRPLAVTDAGVLQTAPAGYPTVALYGTVTSTGANACITIVAGIYQWQCTAAMYANPNVTTVASLDGGAIPSGRLWAAQQLSPLTRVDGATDGGPLFCGMTVSGTGSCLVYKASN